MSRTKVAPLKQQSIPRLELCGALLLANLMSFVKTLPQFLNLEAHFWTDSMIVLAWLSKESSSWKTFVANRVFAIQALAPRESWRHVPTKDNPADLGSRGIEASLLANHILWWQGPPWLQQAQVAWPATKGTIPQSLELETRVPTHHVRVQTSACLDALAGKFSSWQKLIRIVAYILKFSPRHRTAAISQDDLSMTRFCIESRRLWLRHIQRSLFSEEIFRLKSKSTIPKDSAILSLNPFIDENELLRVGGRLINAPLDALKKFPVILGSHPLVMLLIRHAYEKCLHGGAQLTLSSLRQEFWILRARQLVKQVIYKCIPCARIRASLVTQLMAPLPASRVNRPSRPFQHSGIDYAGPINIRLHHGRGHKSHPAYIAVFVCLSVRALHLELVSDYSSNAFIAAFKRFIARRGLPSIMYSDCGTTFKGAIRELDNQFAQVTRDLVVRGFVANERIRWNFIPPAAPHFGGLWEAGVRSVKHHLRRVIGDHTPTFEELSTLLCQIEACLNSRPLGPQSDDPDDLRALTPGHFLIGSELIASPEPTLLDVNTSRLSRWQLWQQLLESFWKHWSSDYLLSLQQRTNWRLQQDSLRVGQMVLLRHDNLPPTKWQLGRIVENHPGPNNLVRVVTVRTATATYKRPISKLALLPLHVKTNVDGDEP